MKTRAAARGSGAEQTGPRLYDLRVAGSGIGAFLDFRIGFRLLAVCPRAAAR
jgi:hypothetical protein